MGQPPGQRTVLASEDKDQSKMPERMCPGSDDGIHHIRVVNGTVKNLYGEESTGTMVECKLCTARGKTPVQVMLTKGELGCKFIPGVDFVTCKTCGKKASEH